jgi:hypothetical protein
MGSFVLGLKFFSAVRFLSDYMKRFVWGVLKICTNANIILEALFICCVLYAMRAIIGNPYTDRYFALPKLMTTVAIKPQIL